MTPRQHFHFATLSHCGVEKKPVIHSRSKQFATVQSTTDTEVSRAHATRRSSSSSDFHTSYPAVSVKNSLIFRGKYCFTLLLEFIFLSYCRALKSVHAALHFESCIRSNRSNLFVFSPNFGERGSTNACRSRGSLRHFVLSVPS